MNIIFTKYPHETSFLGLALASVCSADKLGQYGFGGGFGGSSGGAFGGGSAGGFGGSGTGDFGLNDDSQYAGEEGGDLEEVIPGIPGDDYPIFAEVPDTSFICDGQVDGGYYADPEAECQAFHICAADGTGGLTKYSFLCPNGTLFNQQYFVCDWWFNVDCSIAESLYGLNDEIAAEQQANSPAGGQGQYSGGQAAGQGTYNNGGRSSGGGRGSQGGRRAQQQSSGSRGAASAPRGSYAAPSDNYSSAGSDTAPVYTFPEEVGFRSADSGYGAPSSSSSSSSYASPTDSGYSAPSAGVALNTGYGAPATRRRTGRRRHN